MNLWTIFLTGLLTGGLTCLAVQGGLLATMIANQHKGRLGAFPILVFLLAKLISYTILGILLGTLGSVIQLSLTFRIILQAMVAIFMIGSALNLLEIHPIFRYFVIQPPRILTRLIRNQTKSMSIFAPAVLGAFTIFVPCGTTQAMMALAMASGNPLSGGGVLFTFILGTMPIFFILGYFATKLGQVMQKHFLKIAALTLIFLAVWSLDGTLALAGNPFTLGKLGKNMYCTLAYCQESTSSVAQQSDTGQNISLIIRSNGYFPEKISIKSGSVVNLKVTNENGGGCIQSFTIPKLGIQKSIPVGSSTMISFTAPSQPGSLPFMCSMGMYRGEFTVI